MEQNAAVECAYFSVVNTEGWLSVFLFLCSLGEKVGFCWPQKGQDPTEPVAVSPSTAQVPKSLSLLSRLSIDFFGGKDAPVSPVF